MLGQKEFKVDRFELVILEQNHFNFLPELGLVFIQVLQVVLLLFLIQVEVLPTEITPEEHCELLKVLVFEEFFADTEIKVCLVVIPELELDLLHCDAFHLGD